MEQAEGQQHPISIYLTVWGLLFVLSACSYMVDILGFEGYLRWFLIILFMWLKAGCIITFFMHLRWERPVLVTTILVPPTVLAVLVLLMAVEGKYIFFIRSLLFSP
jgi:cytochrome c oxidase subunit 4